MEAGLVFDRVRAWWRERGEGRRVLARSATCGQEGVTFSEWDGEEEQQTLIAWERVHRVVAFKQDLVAFDEICVVLADRDGAVLMFLSEESGNFVEFVRGLPEWLEGCERPEEWWDRVAFPPFETCERELYQRAVAD